MGKLKRLDGWEGPSAGPPKELDADLGDLDEEIIELEEVIEPHGDGIKEDDELVFDVEILDEGAGLGFGDLESKIESEDEFLLEGDLLKELPFFENRKTEREPPQAKDIAQEGPEGPALGFLLESDESASAQVEGGGEALGSAETEPEALALPVEPPAEASVPLDEFVAQIESRLVDTIREIVETRLPEIVRAVLKEEIERLKIDQEPEA